MLVSEPIWKEYSTVADWLIPVSRKREKEKIFSVLRIQSEWIKPDISLDVYRDMSDNCFLECAVSGKADYLVTKNIRHFPPKKFSSVKIVRISKFLDALETIENLS